jgi:HTH-type transcriptional regulator/antitoxin HigA
MAQGTGLEDEADELAANALIPKKEWKKFAVRSGNSVGEIKRFADSLKVHPAVVAGRIRREKGNYRMLAKLVGRGQVRRWFPAN